MKMNAYKNFHIFACMSVIKTYVTGLVLKDKNAQHYFFFFIFFTNCFNVLMMIFKKPQPYRRLHYFGKLFTQFKNINSKNDGGFVNS